MIGLADLASKNRFVRPRIATSAGPVTIAAATSKIFASYYDGASEGVVVGFSFYTPDENYVAVPISIGQCGADQLREGATTSSVDAWDTLNIALAPRSIPFIFPDSRGYYFERGRAVCLLANNLTAVPVTAEGFLLLLTWNEEDRKQALQTIEEWEGQLGPAFPAFPERLFSS